jgi:hypothetical protein
VSPDQLAVHGQPDALGFISIDCGISNGTSYADESTRGLRFVSDAGFVDAAPVFRYAVRYSGSVLVISLFHTAKG